MILYFNHQYISHPAVQKIILEHRGHDTLDRLKNLSNHNHTQPPLYNRKGVNLLPFKNELIDVPGFSMPDCIPSYNKSWDDITDQRCLELRATKFDRPWIVMWSGGIDSTHIVCALIKNLPPADLKNITIACTPVCVWENSYFYFNYIKPNFKVIDSHHIRQQDIEYQNKFYTLDGEPADQLFGGLSTVLYNMQPNIDLLRKDIVKHSDYAIEFIAKKTNRHFAEWYYQTLISSAASSGVSVTTFHELVWWSVFNHSWVSVKFRLFYYSNWKNVKNVKSYIDQIVHWYDTNDYQQWAMNKNNTDQKLGQQISDYKLAAKKYIHAVNTDNYYMKYKTKMASGDVFDLVSKTKSWCCIDHNWDLLNFDDHADQIIEALPNHLA